MYVYIDILLIINIYINFFLLKATAKLTHSRLTTGRCVLGAAAGSLFSLAVLLPELHIALLLALKLFGAFITVAAAFSVRRECFGNTAVFLLISFVFAGVCHAVAALPSGISVQNNAVVYADISIAALTVSTIAAYIAISLYRRFTDAKNDYDGKYMITVFKNGSKAEFQAVCDSGCNLTDSFSGKPVIVCSKTSVKPIFEASELDGIMQFAQKPDMSALSYMGWRLIPFSTVSFSGLLPSFLPNGVYIKNLETNKIKYAAAYIGIVDKELDYALFNPKIL